MLNRIMQDKLLLGMATLMGTLGGFVDPPKVVTQWLEHPVISFLQTWIAAWVMLQNTEQAFMVALLWVSSLTLLQNKPYDDGRVPHERGNMTSTNVGDDGGVVYHDEIYQ